MEKNEALEQIDYLKKIVSRTKLRAEAGYPFLFLWGIVLIITSYIAKHLVSSLQNIWLAVVGGGTLIISSLIFRNQVKKCE